jgi:hypothetical protein
VSIELKVDDTIIIIASEEHLKVDNFDLHTLKLTDRFISLNAQEILSKFMINGWPDQTLFMNTIREIIL